MVIRLHKMLKSFSGSGAERFWGTMLALTKKIGEMGLADEAELESDLFDREVAAAKERFGFCDDAPFDQFVYDVPRQLAGQGIQFARREVQVSGIERCMALAEIVLLDEHFQLADLFGLFRVDLARVQGLVQTVGRVEQDMDIIGGEGVGRIAFRLAEQQGHDLGEDIGGRTIEVDIGAVIHIIEQAMLFLGGVMTEEAAEDIRFEQDQPAAFRLRDHAVGLAFLDEQDAAGPQFLVLEIDLVFARALGDPQQHKEAVPVMVPCEVIAGIRQRPDDDGQVGG